MAIKTTPGTGPDHLPLKKGSHLVSDILYFFGHQVPGMFSQGMESMALFKGLSQLDDSALEKLGIPRSEIPAFVARKMEFFPSSGPKTATENQH
ncbi:MAG: hypothetical protein IH904_05740 [Proteobacteria bacterium]|nr:hypothetical protein [Pseudomonadota bacterium]